MFCSEEVFVSQSVYTSSSPIFFLTLFLGVAPYSIRKSGEKYILKWSLAYTIYSYTLGSVFVISSFYGIVVHMRLNPLKGEYVVYFSIVFANILSIATIFGAPFRAATFYSYIRNMKKVDEIVIIRDAKKVRSISIAVLFATILGMLMQVSVSMYFMIKINVAYLISFLPHNIQQTFLLVVFECQYAHMVYSIWRRIKIINNSLEAKEVSSTYPSIAPSNNAAVDRLQANLRVQLSEEYGLRLARAYSLLCNAAEDINKSFSYVIVMIIVNCLMKLTETLYFLIFMMLQKYPLGSLITQVFWTFFHVYRLLIIVEPCQMCLSEMTTFMLHLQNRKMEFSLGGLGTLNHKFLTSFMSAIITYLVIVIQFNQAFNSN